MKIVFFQPENMVICNLIEQNAEILLQNRKTFVTLLREFYFFCNENKLYLFPL